MHLDEGALESQLDGELDAASARAARAHLDSCAECRSLLEQLRQDEELLATVLPVLDHPVPQVSRAQIIAHASKRRLGTRWAAAVALLLLAAGAAYAFPGSPLRRWIATAIGRRTQETPRVPDIAGIALPPGEHFTIAFPVPRAAALVTIALTDDAAVGVRRISGAATFTAEIDRLRIDLGDAPAEIDVPRHAPSVAVVAGDRRLFLKDRGRVITEAQRDSAGRYRLLLIPPQKSSRAENRSCQHAGHSNRCVRPRCQARNRAGEHIVASVTPKKERESQVALCLVLLLVRKPSDPVARSRE